MDDSVAAQIKKLFIENEEFRKEFITNTKAICQKYGINLDTDIPIEFRQTSKPGEMKPMKCVIVNYNTTTQGFLICDF